MKTLILIFVQVWCFVRSADVCKDVDTAICKEIVAIRPNMCQEPCLANMCKAYCGECPLSCYECHEIDDPRNCTTKTVCPTKDHYCVTTQSFNDDFVEVYKLGCAQSSLCASTIDPQLLGKRDSNFQGACCQSDDCNNKSPDVLHSMNSNNMMTTMYVEPNATVASPAVISDCMDISNEICTKLAFAMTNMCASDCVASHLCPRVCGKCVECYDCPHVSRPEDCNVTTVCASGQQCFSLATLTATFDQSFRLGCLDPNICSKFTATTPLVGKRQNIPLSGGCCGGDYCNHHMVHPTTTPPPTTTMMTVATTLSPFADCSHVSQSHCPHGFVYSHHSCFYSGTITMNFAQAETFCKAKCGRLADFGSSAEMKTILSDIHSVHNYHDFQALLEHPNYYIDAIFYHDLRWMWSTSRQLVNSDILSSSHSHTHSHVTHTCSYVSISSHAAHSVDCSSLYRPLCEIPGVSHQ